jgi:hypothetical protein
MNNINEFEKIDNCIEEQLNYSKANWNLFKEQFKLDLIDTSAIIRSNNANEINEFLTKSMINAAKRAIPVKTNNLKSNKRLPKYIMDLINTRRKLKRKLITKLYIENKEMWSQFYIINKTIREEIKIIKEKNWGAFIEKIGINPLTYYAVWRRIQVIKNNGHKKADSYPILIHENIKYDTDLKKANIFADLLSETFKDQEIEKYDEKFKNETNKTVEDFINNNDNVIS